MSGKKSDVQKAIDQLDEQIDVLTQARSALMAVQRKVVPERKPRTKREPKPEAQ